MSPVKCFINQHHPGLLHIHIETCIVVFFFTMISFLRFTKHTFIFINYRASRLLKKIMEVCFGSLEVEAILWYILYMMLTYLDMYNYSNLYILNYMGIRVVLCCWLIFGSRLSTSLVVQSSLLHSSLFRKQSCLPQAVENI